MRRNPPRIPADTTAEAFEIQMAANRSRTPQQNMKLFEELNAAVSLMEEAAIRRQFPQKSDAQIQLEIVRRRHGNELAEKCAPILLGENND